MKKLITLLFVLVMALSLSACGSGETPSAVDEALQGVWSAGGEDISGKLIFNNGTVIAQTFVYGNIFHEASGTYEIKENVIALHYDKGDIDDTTVGEIAYTLDGGKLQLEKFEKEGANNILEENSLDDESPKELSAAESRQLITDQLESIKKIENGVAGLVRNLEGIDLTSIDIIHTYETRWKDLASNTYAILDSLTKDIIDGSYNSQYFEIVENIQTVCFRLKDCENLDANNDGEYTESEIIQLVHETEETVVPLLQDTILSIKLLSR